MNNEEAFLLYTTLNMQNSQLPCFIPSISLKPFPHLAHSICHLSLLAAPTLHTPALLCFLHSLPSPSSSALCCFSKYFPSFSLFPTSSISTCPLQPYSHPYIYFPLWAFSFSLSPSLCLPAVWKQYLRHSAPSILSSKWDVWPCYIWFL